MPVDPLHYSIRRVVDYLISAAIADRVLDPARSASHCDVWAAVGPLAAGETHDAVWEMIP